MTEEGTETMTIWQTLRRMFGMEHTAKPRPPQPEHAGQPAQPAHPEPAVAEITVSELAAALDQPDSPWLLDIRELYEWRLVRMAGTRHIPMNSLPQHLDDLPRDREIVVICAHGNRSYSVTAWLVGQGFRAASLAGGITQWAATGGAVEQGVGD